MIAPSIRWLISPIIIADELQNLALFIWLWHSTNSGECWKKTMLVYSVSECRQIPSLGSENICHCDTHKYKHTHAQLDSFEWETTQTCHNFNGALTYVSHKTHGWAVPTPKSSCFGHHLMRKSKKMTWSCDVQKPGLIVLGQPGKVNSRLFSSRCKGVGEATKNSNWVNTLSNIQINLYQPTGYINLYQFIAALQFAYQELSTYNWCLVYWYHLVSRRYINHNPGTTSNWINIAYMW